MLDEETEPETKPNMSEESNSAEVLKLNKVNFNHQPFDGTN